MEQVEINVAGWPEQSGAKAKLYLVPGAENGGTRRFIRWALRRGMPEPAWHRRHLAVGTLPLDVNAARAFQ